MNPYFLKLLLSDPAQPLISKIKPEQRGMVDGVSISFQSDSPRINALVQKFVDDLEYELELDEQLKSGARIGANSNTTLRTPTGNSGFPQEPARGSGDRFIGSDPGTGGGGFGGLDDNNGLGNPRPPFGGTDSGNRNSGGEAGSGRAFSTPPDRSSTLNPRADDLSRRDAIGNSGGTQPLDRQSQRSDLSRTGNSQSGMLGNDRTDAATAVTNQRIARLNQENDALANSNEELRQKMLQLEWELKRRDSLGANASGTAGSNQLSDIVRSPADLQQMNYELDYVRRLNQELTARNQILDDQLNGRAVTSGTTGTRTPSATQESSITTELQAQIDADKLRSNAFRTGDGTLMLLLLFSVCLNIYLGWLARSFYGRYADLADELRDTFNSAM
jgi:hypothetical protein